MKQVKWLLVLMAACMLLLAACGDVTSDPMDTTDTQDTQPQEEIPEILPIAID